MQTQHNTSIQKMDAMNQQGIKGYTGGDSDKEKKEDGGKNPSSKEDGGKKDMK